ncbi:MAG: NAD(P)/FAD-dependent oxidoreductase [Candidatus Omnitrophota bacterium]
MSLKKYDVIIIGGGVVGSAIARELAHYRLKIAILEKEAELAFGISKSNSGIIHPGTQNPPDSLKGKLCVRGNQLVRNIARELGVDFKEVGELIVAFSQEDLTRLKQIKESAECLGVKGLKFVDRLWLKENEPNLSKEIIGALYAPTAGIISPYRFVYDLSENAKDNGVNIFTNTEVQNINVLAKKSFQINTQNILFQTNYIINAAGLYADKIAGLVGINDFKITPRKGEEYLLDKKQAYISNHLIFPLPHKKSKGILIIKTADGNPMVGPTACDIEDKDDTSTTAEGIEEVFNAAEKMIPQIQRRHVIAYFAGLRPVSGDDFIIRYEDTVPGFITVAGIQSPGLTAAPAIAEMVRDLLKTHGLTLNKKLIFQKFRQKTAHLFAVSLKKAEKLIRKKAEYGDIVCRCEMVSAQEIQDAIKRGACTLDGVKFRTRAGAGRCHGGFCTCRILKILTKQLKVDVTKISKKGKGSELIISKTR